MRLIAFLLAALTSTSMVAADLSGNYTVKGSNPGGQGYQGTLTITRAGSAYGLTWNSGGVSTGVGLAIGDALAVAVGEGCAIAGYRISAEGGLDGQWTGPKGGVVGKEKATPGVGTTKGLAGDYVVNGSNPDGKPYKGGLSVAKTDGVLRFSWRTGSNAEGFGIEKDGYAAVAWGAPTCGVVLYRLGKDGNLGGVWRYPGTVEGSETATR